MSPEATDASERRPAIAVEGLTIAWDGVSLMDGLTFDVLDGDLFVILGGSGSGKSTLLRHMIGLEQPMSGTIRIDGLGAPEGKFGEPAFGVMFQSGALFGSMTLLENIALPLRKWTRQPSAAIEAIGAAKLRIVGLGGFENHLPSEISGGMKKRAAIARALALDPSLLFLDEPSAGLDPVTAVELDDLLCSLNQDLGTTIVIVTHELASIFRIARTCILLDKDAKDIIARGDPRELRDHSDDPRVRRFFNREARLA